MRTKRRNKQSLKYSLFVAGGEPIYETDDSGNIVYQYTPSGTKYANQIGETQDHYTEPVEFKASIAMSGGDANYTEYGIDMTDYSAVVIVPNTYNLPIEEDSILWHRNTPTYDEDGFIDKESAEYKVAKISPSVNYTKYLLQKLAV